MTTTETTTRVGNTTAWEISSETSRLTFAVSKRLFFIRGLTVRGRFTDVTGTIRLSDADPAASHVVATVRAASLTTGTGMASRKRDKHVLGRDFFDVERFPAITFSSRDVTAVDTATGRWRITGDLTIRGLTRSVDLDTVAAPDQDPRLPRLKFRATTVLNRHDFGLNWHALRIGIGDEVAITLEVEAVRR